jgi:3-isopropylmalate dehydrogenase
MHAKIAVLPGDGIGPEVVAEGVKVLQGVAATFGHTFEFAEGLAGGVAIDMTGSPLPYESMALCRASDAVLLGAVGGPKWSDPRAPVRPEQGLLALRGGLGLFANLRPVKVYPALASASTLKPEVVAGVDLVIVRELTGGLYFGEPRGAKTVGGVRSAFNTMVYDENEIARITRVAFQAAQGRRKHVTHVHKANVLETSQLWVTVVDEIAREFPDVTLAHQLVDSCAMLLVRDPARFDVIVTENLFGDILSDEAAQITGSMGMLPSASLGAGGIGLYEPVHGSAPDIAGRDIANPLAAILSAAMLLEHSLGALAAAQQIRGAVQAVLDAGHRSVDLLLPGENRPSVGCRAMGDLVVAQLGR